MYAYGPASANAGLLTLLVAGQRSALLGEQLSNSTLREVEQRLELGAGERLTLGRALYLHEGLAVGHHDVQVGVGPRVFLLGQVEQRLVVDQPDADRGDLVGRLGSCQQAPGLEV